MWILTFPNLYYYHLFVSDQRPNIYNCSKEFLFFSNSETHGNAPNRGSTSFLSMG